jgi:hypothetical protein
MQRMSVLYRGKLGVLLRPEYVADSGINSKLKRFI